MEELTYWEIKNINYEHKNFLMKLGELEEDDEDFEIEENSDYED